MTPSQSIKTAAYASLSINHRYVLIVLIGLAIAVSPIIGLVFGIGILPLGYLVGVAIFAVTGVVLLYIALRNTALLSPSTLLMGLWILSLSFAIRFRVFSQPYHAGGAEAAIGLFDIILLGLFVFYFFKSERKGEILYPRIEQHIWILIILSSLSIWNAVAPIYTLYELLRMAKIVMILYVCRHYFQDSQKISLAVLSIMMAVVFQSTLALAQQLYGINFGLWFLGEASSLLVSNLADLSDTISRAGGTMGHPNILAYFLEMTIPLAVSFIIAPNTGRAERLMFLCVAIIGLAGMFITFSRSGWGAVLAGIGIVMLLHFLVANKKSAITLLRILVPLVVVGIFIWSVQDQIVTRIAGSTGNSLLFRTKLNVIALNMFNEYPLFGVGLNNFVDAMPRFDSVYVAFIAPAHNIFLLTLAESGVVGTMAFVWVLWNIFKIGYSVSNSDNKYFATIGIGITSGLAATLFHGLLGWGWRIDALNMTFWCLVGILVSIESLNIQLKHHNYGNES